MDKFLKPSSISDVCFDRQDIKIFKIEDVKTQLETIQNYFFPRLELIVRYSLDLVQAIYGVNPYDSMTFVYRPNHRKNATTNIDYHEAYIGISGKSDNNKDLIIRHESGAPFRFHPTYLYFNISPDDQSMFVYLLLIRYKVDNDFKERIAWLLSNNALAAVFNTLHISHAGPHGTSYVVKYDDFLTGIREGFGSFYSPSYFLPVNMKTGLWQLILSFVGLYPVLDSINLMAEGKRPRLDRMLKKFKYWWETPVECIEEFPQNNSDKQILLPELDSYSFVRAGLWWNVLARDKWTCCSCGRSSKRDGVTLHVDHIKPRSLGGTNDLDNLQTLCWKCNIGKSNKDSTDLRK